MNFRPNFKIRKFRSSFIFILMIYNLFPLISTTSTTKTHLSSSVTPLNYTIRLRPVLEDVFIGNLAKFTSPSTATIRVVASTNSDTIRISQRNLAIETDLVTVTNIETGLNLPIASQSLDHDSDSFTIRLEHSFNVGEHLDIHIPYSIKIPRFDKSNGNNIGLFWDSYIDHDMNQQRYYAATRMPLFHSARHLFPVFDFDSKLKTTFKVIIGRLDNGLYNSIFSAELTHTESDPEDNGWVWDHFQETPPISPHHLLVAVADFASYSVDIPYMKITAWGPRPYIEHGGGVFAVEMVARLMNHYETKFKMEYPLPKLDILYIPSFQYHFDVSPLHSLGVISHPLDYESTAPGFVYQNEDKFLSQEIVKQWFGVITSCTHSSSELQLNEGLASYLSLYWTPENPKLNSVESFPVIRFKQYTMNLYGYWSELSSLDSMDYSSSMLKMMEGFLNKDVMDLALIDIYLHRMKWKEATPLDLFNAIQESIRVHKAENLLPSMEMSIKDLMSDWNIKNGYPLLRVDAIDPHSIQIWPERYISINELAANQTDDTARWWIPLKLITQREGSKEDQFWLPRDSPIPGMTYHGRNGVVLDTEKWLLLNPDASGYYRVLYDAKLSNLLSDTLETNHSVIPPLGRIQLLDDYFELAKTNYVPIEMALELTKYLGKEKNPHVWMVVSTNMQSIIKRFKENDEAFQSLRRYLAPRVQEALNITGGFKKVSKSKFDGHTASVGGVENYDYLYWCGTLEVPACMQFSSELMSRWKSNPRVNPFRTHLPKWLRTSVYCNAVASDSSRSTWDFVLKMVRKGHENDDLYILAQSLACTKDPELLSRLLELSLNESALVRANKSIYRYLGLQRPDMREKLFDFAKRKLVSGQMPPETFANIVHDMKSFSRHPAGMPQAVNHFIHSQRKIIGQPLMEGLEKSVEEIVECKGCAWWSSMGNRIRSWLDEENK